LAKAASPDSEEGDFSRPSSGAEQALRKARLKAWRNDEWHFVGIRAKATLKIPYGSNPDCRITTELSSPGLWGIESISSKSIRMNAISCLP
jgi:hypothetical protein